VGFPWYVVTLGLIGIIVLLFGFLFLVIFFGKWLRRDTKASEAEMLSAQLAQLREMRDNGLLSTVEYDAIRMQLVQRIKASQET
jgi:uncharacterized membrane protein